jgi:hypothetical protein
MITYNEQAKLELEKWKRQMERSPSFAGMLSRRLQTKINSAIPEKVHRAITGAIRQMTRGFLLGAELTTPTPVAGGDLEERELKVRDRIKFYRNAATAEGAITGAGGILLGLADFPIWLALKLKLLCEIAALYGKDVSKLRERIFILYIFELTFSSQAHRNQVFQIINNWKGREKEIPDDINAACAGHRRGSGCGCKPPDDGETRAHRNECLQAAGNHVKKKPRSAGLNKLIQVRALLKYPSSYPHRRNKCDHWCLANGPCQIRENFSDILRPG